MATGSFSKGRFSVLLVVDADCFQRGKRLIDRVDEAFDLGFAHRGRHGAGAAVDQDDASCEQSVEVRTARHAKEVVRSICQIPDPALSGDTSHNSLLISRTTHTHPRSARSAAPSSGGGIRPLPGTEPVSPTDPPKRSTISSNGSASAFGHSPTTASEHCSTPANPTGHSSPPSTPAKFRCASKFDSLTWCFQLLRTEFSMVHNGC